MYVLGHNGRLEYANPPGAQLAGFPASCLTGMMVREVFPDDWLGDYRRCAETALTEKAPGCFRTFCAPLDSWLEWTVYPGERGVLILSRNVTRLVQAGECVHQAVAAVEASRRELQALAGRR